MQVRNSSRIVTTPESIVREFRIADRGVRVASGPASGSESTPARREGPTARREIPVSKEPISKLERAIRIFFLIILGWACGYLHHFLRT
jgi:hypothetical protein